MCSHKNYSKICKGIPTTLIQLIQNIQVYSDVTTALPGLKTNGCCLFVDKCDNKLVCAALKQIIYHNYNRALFKNLPTNLSQDNVKFDLFYAQNFKKSSVNIRFATLSFYSRKVRFHCP